MRNRSGPVRHPQPHPIPLPPPDRPTSRPTPERAAKPTIIPPVMNGRMQPWWGAQTRLDRLLADKLIDLQEHQAAVRFRHDLDVVNNLPPSPLARAGSSRSAGREDHMAHRLDAVGRLQEVRRRVGRERYALLSAVAEDASWAEVGRVLGVRDVTAKARAVAAIKVLGKGRFTDWGRQ